MKEKKEQLSTKEKELEKEERRMEEREKMLKAKIKSAKTQEKTLRRLNKKNGKTDEEIEQELNEEEEEETVTAIAVGDSGVGKTSLLEAYAIHTGITSRAEEDLLDSSEKKFRTFSIPQKSEKKNIETNGGKSKVKPNTSSISTNTKVSNEENSLMGDSNVTLQLVDTETEDSFLRFRALNYKVADVFLLIFSISDRNSFVNAAYEWYEELEFNQPNIPILLVGTKSDLRNSNESSESPDSCVSFAQGESLAAEIHAVGYYEVSVFQEKSLEILFDSIVHLHKLSQAHKWSSSDALNAQPSLPIPNISSVSNDSSSAPSAVPPTGTGEAPAAEGGEVPAAQDHHSRNGKRRELMNKFGFKNKKDRKEKKKEKKEKEVEVEEEEDDTNHSEDLNLPSVPHTTPFLTSSPPPHIPIPSSIQITPFREEEEEFIVIEDTKDKKEDLLKSKKDADFNPSKSADFKPSQTDQKNDGLLSVPAITKSRSATDIKHSKHENGKKEKKEKKNKKHSNYQSEEEKEKERKKEEDFIREREENQSALKEKEEIIARLSQQLEAERSDRGLYLIKDREELEAEKDEVRKERERLLSERKRIQSEEREALLVVQSEKRKAREELKNKGWDIRRKEGRLEEQRDKLLALRRNLDERWHILLMREGGGELGDERKRLEHERQSLDDEKSEFEDTRIRWEQERDDEEEELEAITEELSEREEKLFKDRIRLKSRRRELDERIAESAQAIEEQRKVLEQERTALQRERRQLEMLRREPGK
eukprot:TRINITY_DN4079_c0_g1_i2.p1 TRINITY_DN4079_c0_g1~~TRINITY_DN4079_c0_g1_i2.p1  ORF type:complete len:764 (-),score=375.22 TRINITY_DN4079_c0_g1_i2:69-2360(-)